MLSVIVQLKRALIILITLASSFQCFSQENELLHFPLIFDQSTSFQNLIDPSCFEINEELSLQVGYNGFNQLSNNIRSYYATSGYVFGDSTGIQSRIGINFFNDAEGKFINRSKGYFTYGISIPLREKVFLQSGVAAGFHTFQIKSNTAYAGVSAAAPDMNISSRVLINNFYFGFSLAQLLNNELILLTDATRLKRHAYLHIGYKIELSEQSELTTDFLYQTPSFFGQTLVSTLELKLFKKYLIFTNYRNRFGLVGGLGLHQFEFDNHSLDFSVSYRIPLGELVQRNGGATEIVIKYVLKK